MEKEIAEIIEIPGVRCDYDISAKHLTSYGVGGNIRFLLTIEDSKAVSRIFSWLESSELDYFIVGAGTNILVSDYGFNGAFIRPGKTFQNIRMTSDSSVYAGGATLLSDLISFFRKNKLGGLSFLSGIPGTVGGAIAMNAGAFGYEIASRIISVDCVDSSGEIRHLKPDDCGFDYRHSKIKNQHLLVTGAELTVEPDVRIDEQIDECLLKRAKNHLPGSHYAGSVFKNPTGNYAGKLIDESGLKGLRVGSAFVSERHANFIVADDNGNASDVFDLIRIAALRVYEYFGIKLEPEIQLVGFKMGWDEIFEG